MTLLDDLQALDLSAIVDGKVDIDVVINSDSIIALVGDGAAANVLGDLGTAISTAVQSLDDPAALVAPLTDALITIVGEVDTGDVPVAEYVDAVADAARLIAGLVGMLTGSPEAIEFGGSGSVGQAIERVGGSFGDHAATVGSELSKFRALVQLADGGLPTDVAGLLEPALEILIPFRADSVDAALSWSTTIEARLDGVILDPDLTSGLVNALNQVQVAADMGDAVELQASLDFLTTVQASTVDQLAASLRTVATAVSGISITDGAASLRDLRVILAGADETVFELLDGWREMIASVRETIEGIDPAVAMATFSSILDDVEVRAQEVLVTGVEGAVEVVKQWLRDLLREVPIRPLRLQLSDAITAAAAAIADADLDGPVELVRGALGELSLLLADADPAALVQAAVDELETAVTEAIDALAAALAQITAGVTAVAAEAEAVLQRAVAGLRDFSTVVDDITAAIEQAGIVEAANEITATLEDLREQVSQLVSSAPLPDALRDIVEQLISTLESIDLDAAIGDPLREVAAQVQIPADVASTVRDGLEAIAEAVASLVPADLIADLEAMMGEALSELENLDISSITGGVTSVLDDAASVFDAVSISEIIEPAGEAYAQVLSAVDRVHPRVVLAPAIDLYGQLLGSLPVPDPETMVTRAADVTSQAGESVARTAVEPARQAVSPDAATPAAGEQSSTQREEPPADLRPGDIVRLIGFLPQKLREALTAMDSDDLQTVVDSIDARFRGTATALRRTSNRLAGMEATLTLAIENALMPVSAAQLDAQLALQGSAALSVEGFQVEASFGALVSASPAGLMREIQGERTMIAERCDQTLGDFTGVLADDLDEIAALLDALLPSELFADVHAFLGALDPEPIAAEFDALLAAVVDATPAFLTAAEVELRALEARIRSLIELFNPGALMQRFLGVLDVLREELALLDPGRLADELGEIHAQVKAVLAAYDPLVLAAELDVVVASLAAAVRGLDPSALMPDMSGITTQVARVADILPVNAIAGIGTELELVGAEIRELGVEAMLDAVNALTPEIAEAITILIEAVRNELVALLESIRFSSAGGSVSASVSVGGGT